ncbi:hypothetical protein OUO20_05765 [Arthrobacter sp. FX8]|uniref:hypothetical protein n=1 Tax=Arthrobacter sp. FX8 TaxID=2997335 RepID=UPI00227BB2C3|nr:hypothetical protein [Arthrobacter sp. FX8]WAJ34439.1 hypothetical protein OUO20_05765 [Arthrobacter sp. FX8]
MNAQERHSRFPRIRITVLELFFLLTAVIFAAINPTPGQLMISGVQLALVAIAMAVTNLRKEAAPPEVFLEEEHFDGGGTIPVKGKALSKMWGSQPAVFSVSPQLRMLVLSPTVEALEFSLAYGLGRFFGPWTLKREDVVEIQHVRTWLAPYQGVRAVPVAGRPWTFVTREPATVLACLEELGYPKATEAFSLW